MIIKTSELDIVLGIKSPLPESGLSEVAFAGRSNVGKSSLINTVLGRKKLARTSSSPGKTQTINFYKINDGFYFVDLPGYGFAKVSRSEQEKWAGMINNYLTRSAYLKAVILLVDIRHEPKNSDKEMLEWILASGKQPVIVATKADKIKRNQVPRHLKMLREGLDIKGKDIPLIAFSSETKQGRDELLDLIEGVI